MLRALLEKIVARKGRAFSPEELNPFYETFISEALLTKKSLQEACEITEREMRELYALAYTHYRKKELSYAEEHFRLLVLLNPLRENYWMGYSGSLQLRGDLEKALHGYAVVALLNPENPFPHFHAHECYLALQKRDEAKKAIAFAHEICAEKREYRTLKALCKTIADKGFVSYSPLG